MKKNKFNKDEALAKIKVLINKHYENLGREMFEDIEIEQKQLIEDIDDVLNNTELSQKHLILEAFEIENGIKNENSYL